MNEAEIILSIEHILNNGCNGLECEDCPLTINTGELISGYEILCDAIQEYI